MTTHKLIVISSTNFQQFNPFINHTNSISTNLNVFFFKPQSYGSKHTSSLLDIWIQNPYFISFINLFDFSDLFDFCFKYTKRNQISYVIMQVIGTHFQSWCTQRHDFLFVFQILVFVFFACWG
jgi:hypothetical protein